MQKIKYLITDNNDNMKYYWILNNIDYILYSYHKSYLDVGAFLIISNVRFQELDNMNDIYNNSSLYTVYGDILKYPFTHFNGYEKNDVKHLINRKVKLLTILEF